MPSNVTKEIEKLELRLREVEGAQRTREYDAILEVGQLYISLLARWTALKRRRPTIDGPCPTPTTMPPRPPATPPARLQLQLPFDDGDTLS